MSLLVQRKSDVTADARAVTAFILSDCLTNNELKQVRNNE